MGIWNWLRTLCGRPHVSVEERRKANLSLVARHLAILERREKKGVPEAASRSEFEAEAILLENAAMEACGEGEGTALTELRRRDAVSKTDNSTVVSVPERRLPTHALLVFFDPISWFPVDSVRPTAFSPSPVTKSLLECHSNLNRQADAWFAARWWHPEGAAFAPFDVIAAGRSRLLERLSLFARLDESVPQKTLDHLDAALRHVRGMAEPGGDFDKGTRRAAKDVLGDPLRYETIGAVVEHFRSLAAILANNQQWLRLLRRAWSRSSAPEIILDALKNDLCHGAILPEGFEERLSALLNDWKKI